MFLLLFGSLYFIGGGYCIYMLTNTEREEVTGTIYDLTDYMKDQVQTF